MLFNYFKLGIAALMPVVGTVLFFLFEKRKTFASMPYLLRQLFIGILFGILACIGTEWGIPMNGAVVNCRDAAPLCAGLFFGGPAGIIAGVIGGAERWLAVYWGAGSFTRVACSVSTVLAGVYAALLRRFMFDNKKPGWMLSLVIGVVMEVFHLTMVFLTNLSDAARAAAVVKACSVPMILFSGLSVMTAAIVLTLLSREHFFPDRASVGVSQFIQRWLLICVAITFFLTTAMVFTLQDNMAYRDTQSLLRLSLSDVQAALEDTDDPQNVTQNRHVGEDGYLIVADEEGQIVSSSIKTPKAFLRDMNAVEGIVADTMFTMASDDVLYYVMYTEFNGYTLVSLIPEETALEGRNIVMYVNSFMEILSFAILFAMIYLLIKKIVVNNIRTVNESLAQITNGNLNVTVNVRNSAEFSSLSDDINSTVTTLRHYIDEAAARIDKELEFARSIQVSALPSTFPAFPNRKDFDIYATMDTAKEVGGDFYDFYMTESQRLYFLIADVSGKGIPAAMFMMRAKTQLKSLAETGVPLDEIFRQGNDHLCDGNDAGMFVTAWMGMLDLTTGVLQYVNGGHNPPLLRRKGGSFEYLQSRPGLVLAGMEGMIYRQQELTLAPGDTLFLYTDGVTEATNANTQLYGEARLARCLNQCQYSSMEELCLRVKADVADFVAEAPQFDDITMVAVEYKGQPQHPEISFERAAIEDITAITEFAENELEKLDCPPKIAMRFSIAIDEIYSNIVKFAYGEKGGPCTVRIMENQSPRGVTLEFSDEGIPYNPLLKEDPDITLDAENRSVGGLGIYMVKQFMDEVRYENRGGKNVLQLYKKFE